MKDDFARFQIFAKVPWLNLGDKFVKIKSEINPNWYTWQTVLNFSQGVGRIVRNQNDWGITYMLDGSLANLLHHNRKMFSNEIISRLKIINE